jgi:spermidine synthase
MIHWKQLASAKVKGGKNELKLYQRGDDFSVRIGLQELMNSRVHGSEEALAELACARVEGRATPKVLVGGLGMGYTLAAALAKLPEKARVTIVELVPEVVEWNRQWLGGLAGKPLEDARVDVRTEDVSAVLRSEKASYDAILLDVDNGPDGLTHASNDWLYASAGLTAAKAALRAKGVLAIWSAYTDTAFEKRLAKAGFQVETHHVRARGKSGGSRHVIWLASKR